MQTYKHTCRNKCVNLANVYACFHAYLYTNVQTCKRIVFADIRTYIHICKQEYKHVDINIYIDICVYFFSLLSFFLSLFLFCFLFVKSRNVTNGPVVTQFNESRHRRE